jgi:hypothetical protein
MDEIKKSINNNSELTEAQIMKVFYQIADHGDVILFKNDGLRDKNKITVVITSAAGTFDSIRFDDVSLSAALCKALKKYFLYN